ncbi:replicative DNA helicase [Vampirovibrio chlorellavorus]|uniref:replicative DNA helicase n=1 Tax=Vampirovibrio chlorellavorus TaxID=758823 RepID=UPI0026EEAB23|nr:DnaB-like helicase C-terminal domain-containing protein [Vampirovibrio chlorellavorus]
MHDVETELQPIERLPHSVAVEQGILCGLLQYPALFPQVVGLLQPEHFYSNVHQAIFQAMLDCFEQQVPLEPIALTQALEVSGGLAMAGGSAYLYDLLLGSNPDVQVLNDASLKHWTKLLIDLARRREVILACQDIADSAAQRDQSTYLEEAENLLYLISETFPTDTMEAFDPIEEAIQQLEAETNSPNGVTGLSTGFPTLDNSTHGFQPWQLITVSARPGGGKSAFALNVACHVVLQERKPVLYISLEMTASELMKRAIKAKAGNPKDMDALKIAAMAWKPFQKDLIIEDAAGQTLAAIQSKILKAKKRRPDLALVVVDHIGLIASEPNGKQQNRAYEIQAITSRLKTLAKTIQVPIIQLAQMNRAVDARQDKKPMLSDLRDSGGIEMDSDIVLFTNIERMEDRKPTGVASLTIAKQRDGVQMEIPLLFVPHLTRFREKLMP